MKPETKKYFQFSRRERNGIFLLLFVLIGVIVLKYAWPALLQNSEEEATQLFREQRQHKDREASTKDSVKQSHYPLKPFNPNTLSKDSLIYSGLPPKLAQQILNYRNKGGGFKVKKDFAKLYYLTDSAYQAIEPYLLLPEKVEPPKPIIVEINTADSLQLLKIRGVGPFYAHKILEYRRDAGGYFTLAQLGEAFYIRANTLEEQQSRMAEIKKQLRVDASKIKKLNVNTVTQKQLSHHPYISYGQSKKIVSLRKKMKGIKSWEDLDSKNIFSEREKELLQHYLTF